MPWVCPRCDRQFGRTNQSHTCAPAASPDDWLAARSPEQRAIASAVLEHVYSAGPVEIDAVKAGLFIKRSRTFAELRPSRRGLTLSLLLSRPLDDGRVSKRMQLSANRWVAYVPLADGGEVDDAVRAWLGEAYASSPL